MKLTQGLLPASKVKDGPDNPITSSPYDNGGAEFGTWCFWHPWHALNLKKFNIRPVKKCSHGVQCCHKFTPDECNRIVDYLKSYTPIKKPDKRFKKGYREYFKDSIPCKDFTGQTDRVLLTPYIYNRLIELFSNTEDPPIYYWAD